MTALCHRHSRIIGMGSYLPARTLTNRELSLMVDTSDDWIVSRTGIHERHIAADGEMTSDLATHAALAALDHAGLKAGDIDLVIVATATPDRTFPATAARVQAKLGITKGYAFDIAAVCSGFLFALSTADNSLRAGQARRALVIGAETFSRILDWSDRGTCVLFGDGAGAVVLEAVDGPAEHSRPAILSHYLRTDGQYEDLLYVDGGPSSTRTVGHLRMVGNQVFRHAVGKISEAILEALKAADLTIEQVSWFVPHQANQRIIGGVAQKIGIRPEQVVSTIAEHGNTSAASIPLALDTARRDGRLKSGDLIVLEALGAGFTWGASIVRL
jgi:3-oxoacyl-[acyl-carrier-protein] synthase III